MCLLSFYPPGVMPVREHLENGARFNPHGSGYANGEHYYRSLDPEKAIQAFTALREQCPEPPALFHSRHATGDSPRTLENCHPFRVLVHGKRALVAHNGYLFPHEGEDSDTKIFARDILYRYDLDDPAHVALLEERMGPNRAVILREGRALILNAHQGITLPDGTWHSNTDYLGVRTLTSGRCLYATHKTHACYNPGELLLGDKLICRPCDKKARERRELLMEG